MAKKIWTGFYLTAALLCLAWYGRQNYWLWQCRREVQAADRVCMPAMDAYSRKLGNVILTEAKKYPGEFGRSWSKRLHNYEITAQNALDAIGSERQKEAMQILLQDTVMKRFLDHALPDNAHRYRQMLQQSTYPSVDSLEWHIINFYIHGMVFDIVGVDWGCGFGPDPQFSPTQFNMPPGVPQEAFIYLSAYGQYRNASTIFLIDGDTLPNLGTGFRTIGHLKQTFIRPGVYSIPVVALHKGYPEDTLHRYSRTFQIYVE